MTHPARDQPSSDDPTAGRIRITLVVCDDHPTFARGLVQLFKGEAPDIEVVGVANGGAEAERLVAEELPDVVLMDIQMPGIDGIEATRRVCAASPSTKVVMLTVSDKAADLYAALRAGASGFVNKEQDVAEILTAVRSVNRGQLIIPAYLAGDFLHDLEGSDAVALNETERAILAGIARGNTNREIGQAFHLSERTVRRRVEAIYSKLHLADRIEAAIYASKRGL